MDGNNNNTVIEYVYIAKVRKLAQKFVLLFAFIVNYIINEMASHLELYPTTI